MADKQTTESCAVKPYQFTQAQKDAFHKYLRLEIDNRHPCEVLRMAVAIGGLSEKRA